MLSNSGCNPDVFVGKEKMSLIKANFNENGLFEITLNRADKRNAFNAEMIEELTSAFHEAEKNENVKVVLIKAEGKSFSAGADLNWMKSMVEYDFDKNFDDSKKLYDMFEVARELSQPLVGLVKGHVMGGALGLVSVCDIVASEASTQFGFTEVRLGLVPAVISPFVLRKININKAYEFMLSGDLFNAQEAYDAGLIHFVGSEIEVNEYIANKIKSFTTVSSDAVKETKKLLQFLEIEENEIEVKEKVCTIISERRISEDAQDRMKSFLGK